ncbi:MAG: bifunctional diaminohydroxyphosphoribosylaminopyrimidine deaminase/5-amino-6-(5-phosphoribosylamino)uracil reductase RibD [Chitinophagaceae bacterium]
MTNDSAIMHRCIELAGLAAGFTAPNPMVGAVLVHEDKIIGEGYHHVYGEAHAEVNCIKDAEARYGPGPTSGMLAKSTLYVSLEPCAHFGKTPPCADLIIERNIPEVVIGCRDPFEEVNGKGTEKLKAAGIQVRSGVLEQECQILNKRFFTFHTRQRPFIILKWAQSADGKIAGHDRARFYISNEITNRLVHKWRSEEAGILVGTHTARVDDPLLTNRLWTGKNPVRLVIDMFLRLPASLQVFNDSARTIIFNALKHEETPQLLYYQVTGEGSLINQIVHALFKLNILSILVEGGANTIQQFIDEDLWDEIRIITNQTLQIGHGIDAPRLGKTSLAGITNLGSDTIRILEKA